MATRMMRPKIIFHFQFSKAIWLRTVLAELLKSSDKAAIVSVFSARIVIFSPLLIVLSKFYLVILSTSSVSFDNEANLSTSSGLLYSFIFAFRIGTNGFISYIFALLILYSLKAFMNSS